MRTKSEERRQRIIDLAAEAFRDLGFEQTSMAEIASRVGGSKATLYNYFESKEALFVAVMHQAAAQQFESAFRHLQPAADLRGALQRFGENFISVVSSPAFLGMWRTVVAESARNDIGRLFYANGPSKGVDRMCAFLEAAVAAGQLRECDRRIAAIHLRGLLESEIREPLLFRLVDALSAEEISAAVSRALDVFLAAYGRA